MKTVSPDCLRRMSLRRRQTHRWLTDTTSLARRKVSFPRSQLSTTGPYPDPSESNIRPEVMLLAEVYCTASFLRYSGWTCVCDSSQPNSTGPGASWKCDSGSLTKIIRNSWNRMVYCNMVTEVLKLLLFMEPAGIKWDSFSGTKFTCCFLNLKVQNKTVDWVLNIPAVFFLTWRYKVRQLIGY